MRSCMYCGKELADGEKCSCSASRARRGEDIGGEPPRNDGKDTKEKKAKENKTRRRAERKNPFERAKSRAGTWSASSGSVNRTGAWHGIKDYIVAAIKNPVDAAVNPRMLGKGAMALIAAAAGAALWLCAFFIARGRAVGPIKFISSAMGFGEGWTLIAKIAATVLSGAIAGIVLMFLYTGIFYLINRFIMRLKTPYTRFCERLLAAWIPFTLLCLIGTVLSILSPITLAALAACGAAEVAVLTYEGLKTEWIMYPPSKVLMAMTLGFFVFLSVIARLV